MNAVKKRVLTGVQYKILIINEKLKMFLMIYECFTNKQKINVHIAFIIIVERCYQMGV